ncbi:DUF397 domain-containing protein [Streptomyces sp. NPDC088745]|uniref:DUF397 domain-containing protein n=1 Tax=Streptomyces sp. NPDC088745 TaxID=3365884 RepID=UPI003826E990
MEHGTWRTSSYTNGDGGACVEIQDDHPTHIPVRDTKDRTGPVLQHTRPTWALFVDAVKSGAL